MASTTGTELPGSTTPDGAQEAGPPSGTSRQIKRGPALVFVGLVAFIGLGGFALAATTSHPRSSGLSPSTKRLKGVSLAAAPAAKALKAVERGGEPPRDITDALVVPLGAKETGSHCGAGLDLYDCAVHLAVQARPSAVVAFYRAELRHNGWSVLAVDATAGNGTEVYAQHPSSDGYYWEVGVGVEPATPSITPALSGSGESAPTSTVSLRVVERNDSD